MDHSSKLACAAIIKEAVKDWRRWKDVRVRPGNLLPGDIHKWVNAKALGYATVHDEVLDFFQGVWFEELCEGVGRSICPYAIRAELEIPDEVPSRLPVQLVMSSVVG